MVRWLLFLHIAAVFAFLLAHGVQVTVLWKQRIEADPERNLALFEALPNARLLRLLAAAVILTGFLPVLVHSWWDRWWIWLSVLLLAAVWVVMYRFGGAYYELIESAAASAIAARGTPDEQAAAAEFERARLAWHPIGLSVIGVGGLAAILWLMVFKPF